jgi:TRAP-type uncharacterized transport system substrate-binding protein
MFPNPLRPVGRRGLGLSLGGALLAADAAAQVVRGGPAPPALPPPAPAAVGGLPVGVRDGAELFTILGSTMLGTYTQIADDISRVLSEYYPSGPRTDTVLAGGGLQSVHDLVRLDMFTGAILSSVVLEVIRQVGWLPELTQRISYVTQLYNEEVHIVTSQLYQDVSSLNGKPVNVGPLGGGTDVIARRMFELLGVQPQYDNRGTLPALREVPTGAVAAVVYIAGKPVPLFRDFGPVGNLRFLPIRVPVERRAAVAQYFRSGVLLPSDYPNFVPIGTQVETLSSPVFLMVRNQEGTEKRQQALATLETEFVNSIVTLQTGAAQGVFHPKWREMSVLERLPGFRRTPALLQWFVRDDSPG